MNDQIQQWAEAGLDFDVKNGLALMTLNRPHVLNGVSRPLRNALLDALELINLDPEIRAALVTGAGRAFCSGADLSQDDVHDLSPERRRGTDVHIRREDGLSYGWWRVIERVWENKKPIVAAVNGPAYGFGCNFAFASDLVIAAESARFCEIFVQRGLPLEASGAYLLSRSISPVRARELALFGEPLSGAKAEEWGLVNRCVPDDQLMGVATEWAEKLAAGPTIGLGHIKSQINQGLDMNIRQTWRDEVTFLGIGIGDDGAEAMMSFKEKRKPEFRGR
ncbi:enoyl-CoA hydratase/isomerase family protein [Nocardioides sp.]|uniref:enoyl-CoA hydratase/isomerase family protein n=1 Tax=Nocardioides sp. TaxID=35761 RepID=UPI00273256B2|nr:enoyl-CoA hydratase-related protein [Nocardioides sp.]MDP3893577.1 enoyl-CoA hydratase-related protein [Nocardioides sp.]